MSQDQLYSQMLEQMMSQTEPGLLFKNLDRSAAEAFLQKAGRGSYVVRPSKQAGSLSVSYLAEDGQSGHTLITKSFEGWHIAGRQRTYRTVKALVKCEFYGLRIDGVLTKGDGAEPGGGSQSTVATEGLYAMPPPKAGLIAAGGTQVGGGGHYGVPPPKPSGGGGGGGGDDGAGESIYGVPPPKIGAGAAGGAGLYGAPPPKPGGGGGGGADVTYLPAPKKAPPHLRHKDRRDSGKWTPTGGVQDQIQLDLIRMTEPGIDFRNIGREDAEKVLRDLGPGAYLVRPSRQAGCMCASYRHKTSGALRHVLLTKSDAGWSSEDDDHAFATIRALLNHLAPTYGITMVDNVAPPAASEYMAVSLRSLDTPDDMFSECSFWRPAASRQDAEKELLQEDADRGLVRRSSNKAAFAVISYMKDGRIRHTPIHVHGSKLAMQGLDGETFDDIDAIFAWLGVAKMDEPGEVIIENQYDALPREMLSSLGKGGGAR